MGSDGEKEGIAVDGLYVGRKVGAYEGLYEGFDGLKVGATVDGLNDGSAVLGLAVDGANDGAAVLG